ncbi:type III secretion system export apparatus subunit SctU [Mycetohabitans sp. B2]|jgi:type III secretion protein U|uniref:type III secretion system export apparatus subunit SctU n=1 Tax=Mycetohabitans sp. B2 TaxID=2841274 RepID=UPI001F030C8D|nr:type III secretion system export apparatus subunit SctU [Mycetohabitans sp. B2]MCF7697515.1 type III secretion system export apparatus subunit SctU [Mycetohabitans sp. B2]
MSDEKTEEPTEKRLRDARRDGQVAKSTDLTDAAVMCASIAVLLAAAGMFADAFRALIHTMLDFIATDRSNAMLIASAFKLGRVSLTVIVPCVAAATLCAFAALFTQVGFQISTKPVTPNPMAVSPASGIKRIFSLRTLVDMIKSLLKALLVACVMWYTICGLIPLIATSLYQPLPALSRLFWSILLKLFSIAAILFVVIAALDFKLQKMIFMRQMRMSKDEIKREYKQQEGDPRLKGERKRIAREWAQEAPPRLRVGLANALIVNPTHYAVAIRYAPDEYPLPVVIAKGHDESAAELRRYAAQARVPIIGNPPVARALHRVQIDEPIPEALFEAVAAILRWVDSLGPRQAASVDTATSAP